MSDERFQKKIEGILEALRITLQVIADLQTTTTLPKKTYATFATFLDTGFRNARRFLLHFKIIV